MNTHTLIKVWDLPLRVFHWLLVVSFTLAYLTEDDLLTVHAWAGYLVFSLLVFRLAWGFLGNEYARFSNFLCKPSESYRYIKDVIALKAKRHIGHNPAGAAMIVLLLTSLLITALTGLAVYGAEQNAGPLASFISPDYEKLWEEAHELSANFSLLLVFIHIAGVAIESFLHHENLARSMVHGFKKSNDD